MSGDGWYTAQCWVGLYCSLALSIIWDTGASAFRVSDVSFFGVLSSASAFFLASPR